jgi:hypothetical protein
VFPLALWITVLVAALGFYWGPAVFSVRLGWLFAKRVQFEALHLCGNRLGSDIPGLRSFLQTQSVVASVDRTVRPLLAAYVGIGG